MYTSRFFLTDCIVTAVAILQDGSTYEDTLIAQMATPPTVRPQALLEKTWKKGSSFPGNFVILREKIKKYIREICHSGGKFCSACQEINIFFFQAWPQVILRPKVYSGKQNIKDLMHCGIEKWINRCIVGYIFIPFQSHNASIFDILLSGIYLMEAIKGKNTFLGYEGYLQ